MSPAINLIPSVTFQVMSKGKPIAITSDEFFSKRSVALFGIPGAFTPPCHILHLPGIISELKCFKEGGSDIVACTAVNDVFVLDAWAQSLGVSDELLFLADGNGDFARGLGLLFDGRPLGLGYRSKRYAMWVNNGVIQHLLVEPDPTQADVSSAHALLRMFDQWASAGA
jgi:peroxiredoxin